MTSSNGTMLLGLGAIAAALAIGCSNTIIEDDDDGGGGAATTAATGSTKASSASTGGACDGFDDATTGTPLTIRVHNPGFLPVYLPLNCGAPVYDILTGDGAVGSYPGRRGCLTTCEGLQTSPRVFCGGCPPDAQRIDPGASFEIAWDGRGLFTQMMPLACFEDPNDGGECATYVSAPTGLPYSFQISGFASCEDGVGPCACTADGHCIGDASGASTSILPPAGAFTHGAASVIDVSFDVCAFGCPGEDGGH